jgi:hypothetical protein
MHRILIALALFGAPVSGQDDARIRELIQKLDDDSFEIREQAEKDLVAVGEPALPLLKKAAEESEKRKEQGELRVRAASALRSIEFAVRSRQVYVDPKLVTLRRTGAELAGILVELENQTGVKFDASSIDTKEPVTVEALKAPLFKVLDDLCRGQEGRTYEYREEGVKFQKERHPPFPTAYEGPFRIRIVKLKQERSTDFKAKVAQVQLSLDADWQKYLSPSKKYDLEIKKATDDKGGSLEVHRGEDADDGNAGMIVGGGRIVMRRAVMMAGMAGVADSAAQPWTLKGLSSGATRLSIAGVARFSFPLDKTDVTFDKPAAGDSREAGEYTIALKSLVAGRLWSVTFTRSKGRPDAGPEDIENRLDRESLVAIDEDGNEHKGQLLPTHATVQVFVGGGGAVPEGTPLATFQAMFPTLRNRAPKEIRFKFVGQAFLKSVPFTLENVELP